MSGADIYHADDWILLRGLDSDEIARRAVTAKLQNVWQEIVPGIDSLALKYDPYALNAKDAGEIALRIIDGTTHIETIAPPPIALPICYDTAFGPDQTVVARHLDIAVSDVPQWHMAQEYHVAMLGFLPGFAYLRCAANIPDIPRLNIPRAQVAAGSVGLLGRQCGLYPMQGPGGWPIIGRMAARLFDIAAQPPAALSPGQRVMFRAISRIEFEAAEFGART